MAPRLPYRIYYAAIVIGAAILLVLGTPTIGAIPWMALALWVALMTLTELAPVKLPGGGVITVSSVLDFAGIIVLGPYLTAWVDIFSLIICRVALRPSRPVSRTAFNLALFALTTILSGEVYRLLGGVPGRFDLPGDFPAALGMGGTYFLVNTIGVSLVISLSSGRGARDVWSANFRWTLLHLLAFLPFGCIVALLYLQLSLLGVLLFVFPMLLARYSFQLYTEMRRDFRDFVETLTLLIDEVDPYTRRHSLRVADYAVQIAREMEVSGRDLESIRMAGLLHDLGKVSFRTLDIVESPHKLTREQRGRLIRHPQIGADIVSRVRMLRDSAEFVRAHHERIDGTGYPHGLRGDEIPLGARVLMVADTLDAMTSDRSYRRALTLRATLEELRQGAGRQFDEDVVAAVERLHARKELRVLYDEFQAPGEGTRTAAVAGPAE